MSAERELVEALPYLGQQTVELAWGLIDDSKLAAALALPDPLDRLKRCAELLMELLPTPDDETSMRHAVLLSVCRFGALRKLNELGLMDG